MKNLSNNQLNKLKKAAIAYNKRWAKSKPLAIYECPCCSKPIQTPMPTKELVDSRGYWDSLTTCYHCGELYFVVRYPVDGNDYSTNGKIFTKTLE